MIIAESESETGNYIEVPYHIVGIGNHKRRDISYPQGDLVLCR